MQSFNKQGSLFFDPIAHWQPLLDSRTDQIALLYFVVRMPIGNLSQTYVLTQ